jgi:hypothetical protein
MGMVPVYWLKSTFFNLMQDAKAYVPNEVTPAGIVKAALLFAALAEPRLLQFRKQEVPIVVKVPGKDVKSSAAHSSNADAPKFCTFGIDTLARALQYLKAESARLSTFGIDTLARP